MPDWEYRKHFKFMGGTPGKGAGSLWKCCYCGKLVNASWGIAAKHFWKHYNYIKDIQRGKIMGDVAKRKGEK